MRLVKTSNGVLLPGEWAPYLTQYTVEDNSAMAFELIHKPLWFTRTYTDNTTTVLNFFDAALATEDLANAVLPFQESYLLKGFGVFLKAVIQVTDAGAAGAFASQIGDMQLIANTGLLDLTIGRKTYGPFPLYRLAPGAGVWGGIAASGAEAVNLVHEWGQIGMPHPDALYRLAIPLVIPAQTQCAVRMRWPAGAVNLTGNQVLTLLWEGITASPLQ